MLRIILQVLVGLALVAMVSLIFLDSSRFEEQRVWIFTACLVIAIGVAAGIVSLWRNEG